MPTCSLASTWDFHERTRAEVCDVLLDYFIPVDNTAATGNAQIGSVNDVEVGAEFYKGFGHDRSWYLPVHGTGILEATCLAPNGELWPAGTKFLFGGELETKLPRGASAPNAPAIPVKVTAHLEVVHLHHSLSYE